MGKLNFFSECEEPKLLKFGGKASEFSPRARFRSWLGYVCFNTLYNSIFQKFFKLEN